MIGVMLVKGESNRLNGKNFREFGGKPLWEITAEKFEELGLSYIIVSDEKSDNLIPDKDGRRVICRPDWIGETSQDVLDWLVESIPVEEPILLLQATNPMASVRFIRQCISEFVGNKIQALVSINPYTCKPNGDMYITRSGDIYREDMWVAFNWIPSHRSVHIDTYEDYCVALALDRGDVVFVQ